MKETFQRITRAHRATLILGLLLVAAPAMAQTLAKPGWVGSGLNTDPWWQRAVFYQVAAPPPPDTVDFEALAVRLEAIRALGADALLLPAPTLPTDGGPIPSLDDLDDLLHRAGNQGLHVLLTLHATAAQANLSGIARFWLSHGVAGLYVDTPPRTSPADTQASVQTLRKLAASALGHRIVVSDLDLAPPEAAKAARLAATPRPLAPAAQLQIDTRLNRIALDAASLRPLLAQTIAQPNLLVALHAPDAATPDAHPPLAEAVATIALLTHPAALIDSNANLVLEPSAEPAEPAQPEPAPPPPPVAQPGTYLPYVPYVPPPRPHPAVASKPKPADPLTTWYQKLATLHHDNAVIRLGTKTLLDFDAQNALVWVNRPAKPSPVTPPIVVVCNLSAAPVTLSLGTAMKSLNLQGWFLRPLLRSYDSMGAQDIDGVVVPAFGVFIGELRR